MNLEVSMQSNMKVAENKLPDLDLDLFSGTHEEKLQQQAETLYVSSNSSSHSLAY